jgi:hypothetical protein
MQQEAKHVAMRAPGTDLLGPSRADGLVDGTHPNDLGFQSMAEGLTERLRKVLGCKFAGALSKQNGPRIDTDING